MNSCRKALDCLCKDDGASNASLVMERFLAEIEDASKDARGGDSAIMARTRLYEQMKKALKCAKDVYETSYRRRENAFKAAGAMLLEFRTTAPLAVGLGGKNVLENGLSLEHTYGVPIIPASSLKGVLAAYCAEALKNAAPGGEAAAAWLENSKVIFGSAAADGASAKGYVRFHDAWITPESLENCLHDDVVTCHHSGYYSKQEPAVPSDFDDPVPVSFVSVRGTFLVGCDCEEPDAGRKKDLLAGIEKLFEHVLGERGVGAKRSSGYGRLNRQQSAQEASRETLREMARKGGMRYIEGDIVEAMCCGSRKVKGKIKPRYKLVDEDSAQNVSFSPGIPHAREGETFRAEVIACDLEKKIYTLKLIEEP
ncbi:type III-B CRISPR module RAMP protein Cmr6 [Pyramidobacter sp. YE332]|uniref:type III-B CRISPR module RAMP protein Cmr6 n=1 Tax=unclassified Pyramidobacter TaxID=2632171 RepID=UPI00098FF8F8|nr:MULTISPECIES: type III-B CRISPR module RAMP protein Cmr6 [unclassified Pyramidobacter]OON86629.1 type III-B CRISPR module RAMP protein Cmr6 [Pyramidobacter sp. C12-8]WOL39878.1 type III-B CRISPR module RAMP protein Cmr6 [Pyramidobacter sp. YE332]